MCVVTRQISNIVCIAARYLNDVINVGKTQQTGPVSLVDWLDHDHDAQGTQDIYCLSLCLYGINT